MNYKPRFHALFYIYAIFGAVFIGMLYFIFTIKIGEKTENKYLHVINIEFKDTIGEVGVLSVADYAYMHSGEIKIIRLKTKHEVEFALYLESYNNENNIKPGDYIYKSRNSNIIRIKSNEEEFEIKLKDIREIRLYERKTEGIKWLLVYVLTGIVVALIPMKRYDRRK